MSRTFVVVFLGLVVGILLGFGILFYVKTSRGNYFVSPILSHLKSKQVIGFLPYWLLTNAKTDYSPYVTTLTYFGLRIDSDGSILKLTSPQEEEPGWLALASQKLTPYFAAAKKNGVSLSLLFAAGGNETIGFLISDPVTHAKNLVLDAKPLLTKYDFSDLNLDIEYVGDASMSARQNFTTFVKTVRENLPQQYSLTVDVTGDDLVRKELIDAHDVGKIADNVVIMAYDFHFPGSFVTGPVAPLSGAGISAEYDVTSAVDAALKIIPAQKIIRGIPDYGYEWETLNSSARSAVIPGTGVVSSNRRVEEFLKTCATCSATFSDIDQEMHVSYTDQETQTIYQIFYPTSNSTQAKVDLSNNANLGGVAVWALGYEGDSILNPLASYK